jgi:signal transduction histidine kinase
MSSDLHARDDEHRILVLAPAGKDARLAREVLGRHGLTGVACADLDVLYQEWARGAAVLLVAEEAVASRGIDVLASRIASQPPWSDIPVLVFVRRPVTPASLARLDALRHVIVLERPIRIGALVNTINAAVRARLRQYELRDLMTELREANRAKDEFLAMVSHELRTPLNVIQGVSRTLHLKAGDPPRVLAAAETIGRNADLLGRLVEDLLDVSRLQKRRLRLMRGSVTLSRVIAASIEQVRAGADAKGVRIISEIVAEPGPMLGDEIRLQQVMSNLLANSIRYTPAGGVVRVTLDSTGDEAKVTVSDTGAGIAPEFLPHVFDPFRQEHATGARHGGLGLGLTIVRQLVELHGGSVSAASGGPGQGTAFAVRLPLGAAATAGH